jgi:hypothetical protein
MSETSVNDSDPMPSPDQLSWNDQPLILPIRHHSPSCAFHVRRAIELVRPTHVLIEGPSDADSLIDVLLDHETVPPMAIYAYVRQVPTDSSARRLVGLSASLFYPFCEYSPEYVALQTGRELGAKSAFIDLPSWRMAGPAQSDSPRINGYADRELAHHRFVQELCKRTQTRSFDELWDALFEASASKESTENYFAKVGTYGLLTREHARSASLVDHHNDEREAYMAASIDEAVQAGGRVVAVVGAFHRAGILARLSAVNKPVLPAPPKDRGIYVTLYGYEQLDRWNGYESGMPAPEFFHRLWSDFDRPMRDAVSGHLSRLAVAFRQQGETISTADLIGAANHLEGLCRLRGHERPTLDDLRDSVRSVWMKSPVDQDGSALLRMLERELVGTRVGQVSSLAGRPPIVEDFYRSLKELGFVRSQGVSELARPRNVLLSIYREPRHRQKSAFLHRLAELGCPLAKRTQGPDFVANEDIDRATETWQLHWKPIVESSMVESSPLGATVREAAMQHLVRRYANEANPNARSAVEQLTAALVMDLVEAAEPLWDQVEQAIEIEPSFGAAAGALAGLLHLRRYRTLLQAERIAAMSRWIGLAYRRSVWLLDTLPGLPPADPAAAIGKSPADEAVAGLILLRHAALAPGEEAIDPEDFIESLARLVDRLADQPVVEGAVLGMLRRWERVNEADLRRSMADRARRAMSNPAELGDWLRGLIAVRRHALVEDESLLGVLHDFVAAGSEETFRSWVGYGRLAFAPLSPGELQRLGEKVEQWIAPVADRSPISTELDVSRGERIDGEVAAILRKMGW